MHHDRRLAQILDNEAKIMVDYALFALKFWPFSTSPIEINYFFKENILSCVSGVVNQKKANKLFCRRGVILFDLNNNQMRFH